MGGVGLIFGIVMLVAGAVQIFMNKKNKNALTTSYIFSAFCIVYGVVLLLAEFLATESALITIFISGIGLMLIIMFIASIYNTSCCTEKIEAEFVGVKHSSKNMYMPVFSYRYDLEDYEAPSVQAYSDTYLRRHFTEGEKYEIYICPTKPAVNVTNRKIRASEIFVVILGIVFFIFGLMPYIRPDVFSFKV